MVIALLLGIVATTSQAIRATMAEKRTLVEQEQTKSQRDRAIRAEAVAQAESELAKQLAQQEQFARRDSEQNFYDAHMTFVQDAYEQGRRSRVLELLNRFRSPSIPGSEDLRQFEWYYWWRRCHQYSMSISRNSQSTTVEGQGATFSSDESHGITFSPDGETVVIARELWDVSTGKRLGTFYYDGEKELNDRIAELREVFRAAPNDAKAKEALDAAKAKGADTTRTTFSPDGKMLATMVRHTVGSSTIHPSTIHLFDVATFRQLRVITIGRAQRGGQYWIGPAALLEFSPDGARLASMPFVMPLDTPQEIYICDPSIGEVRTVLKPSGESIMAHEQPGMGPSTSMVNCTRTLAFSCDGAVLATGGHDEQGDGITQLWDLSTGEVLKTLRPKDGHKAPSRLLFLTGDTRLRAQSLYGKITIWDLATGRIVESTSIPVKGEFSPDGRLAVNRGRHGSFEIWDVASGTQSVTLLGHGKRISGFAFSRDGTTLVSVRGQEDDIKFWDVSSDRRYHDYVTIPGISHSWGYNLFAFSPNSRTVACCNERGTVDLWDTASYSRVRVLHYGYYGPTNAVAFAPDGHILASAGRDLDSGKFRIDLRDLRTGSTRSVGEHVQPVQSLEFTGDGQRLASADNKGNLQVWDLVSGELTVADPEDQSESEEENIFLGHDGIEYRGFPRNVETCAFRRMAR